MSEYCLTHKSTKKKHTIIRQGTIIYSVKRYIALPKLIFARELAYFENCIDCDVVQVSMKIYSSSGL